MSRTLTKTQLMAKRKALGAVLRGLRKANGEIQSDVAERAALSLPTIIEIERATRDYHVDSLIKLCHAQGLDLAALVEAAQQKG